MMRARKPGLAAVAIRYPLISLLAFVARSLATSRSGASLYSAKPRVRTLARQHRPESPPPEEVDVEVGHLLAAVRADIDEQPVTGRDQLFVARDRADGAD